MILTANLCGFSWIWRTPAGNLPWQWAEEKQRVQAEGVVYQIETTTRTSIYLKNANLTISSKKYPIRNIKGIIEEKIEDSEIKIQPGARIRLEGILTLPQLPTNPGMFHQRNYERGKKIDFHLEDAKVVTVVQEPSTGSVLMEQWKEEILRRCSEIFPESEAGVLEAMLLGEKKQLESEVKEAYQAAGISHIIAISGLHISLIGMGIVKILQHFGLPVPVWAILSVGSMIGYGVFIGQPVTAVRAIGMFVILQTARVIGRSYDLLSALALVGILMLVENPDLLYDSGCLLSFGAVIGTGWYSSQKITLWRGWRENRGRSEGIVWKTWEKILEGVYLWLFSLPILLWTFYQVSVVGILWNLLVIPILPFVVVSGGIAILLAGWNVTLGSVAGTISYGILQLYQKIGEWSEQCSFGSWTPGQPEILQIVVYYGLMLGIGMLPVWFKKKKEIQDKKYGVPGMEIGMMILLILLMAHPWRTNEQITVLDVGQGDGIVCQTGKEVLLIDGGSSSQKKVGTYVILPYLKQQGITKITAVAVTHTDQDHINGIMEVLEEGKKGWLEIEHLFYPIWMEKTTQGEELIAMAEEGGTLCEGIGQGDQLQIGNGMGKILYPKTSETEIPEDPNEGSLVILWEWAGIKTLFTGDLPEEKEKEISNVLENCEILKVGHHGSSTSSGQELLNRIQPLVSIVSCAKTNRYGHPSPETIQRLLEVDSEIYYTMEGGAVTVKKIGKKLNIVEYQKQESEH